MVDPKPKATFVGTDGRIIPRADGNVLLVDAYNLLRKDKERIQEDLERVERELFDFRRSRSPTLMSMNDAESTAKFQQMESQNTEMAAKLKGLEAERPQVAASVRDVRKGLSNAASRLFKEASEKHGVQPAAEDIPRAPDVQTELAQLIQLKDNMLMMLTSVANQREQTENETRGLRGTFEKEIHEHKHKSESADAEIRRVRHELQALQLLYEQVTAERASMEKEKETIKQERASVERELQTAEARQESLQRERDSHAEAREAAERASQAKGATEVSARQEADRVRLQEGEARLRQGIVLDGYTAGAELHRSLTAAALQIAASAAQEVAVIKRVQLETPPIQPSDRFRQYSSTKPNPTRGRTPLGGGGRASAAQPRPRSASRHSPTRRQQPSESPNPGRENAQRRSASGAGPMPRRNSGDYTRTGTDRYQAPPGAHHESFRLAGSQSTSTRAVSRRRNNAPNPSVNASRRSQTSVHGQGAARYVRRGPGVRGFGDNPR
eukprot:Hpha_TRINITY_DN7532_c0_g1::TRINITY_DN7532_c0_g1_i1::g.18858::m.18858